MHTNYNIFFFHSQVLVSLMEAGTLTKSHDELIELVACSETGFLHLFSQQQLQVGKCLALSHFDMHGESTNLNLFWMSRFTGISTV